MNTHHGAPGPKYLQTVAQYGLRPLPPTTIRTYTRHVGDEEQSITVNIGPDSRVRMTAANLHEILEHLGFHRTDIQENP